MTKISVVIPVYNGENTIKKALNSLISQTFTDFEAIIINDGSEDKTKEIAQKYCKKDFRFSLISYKENKGVSYARNQGLKKAKGKWISLLDADDWFANQRLERLFTAAETLEADVVFDNLKIVKPNNHKIIEITCFGDKGATTSISLKELFDLDTPYMNFAIGYVSPFVRLQFIKDKKITYNEQYSFGEDFTFLAEMILKDASAYILPFSDYYYVFKPAGNQKQSEYMLLENKYDNVIEACNKFLSRHKDIDSKKTMLSIKRRYDLFICLGKARALRNQGLRKGLLHRIFDLFSCPHCFWFLIKICFLRFNRMKKII